MGSKCICDIADSFNVRVQDLIHPRCPEHGVPHHLLAKLDHEVGEPATMTEIESLVMESIGEVDFNGRIVKLVTSSYGPTEIVRNLFNRYDIRRKQ